MISIFEGEGDFLNNLRQIRENAGLSVSALAEASGVSAVTVHRLEEEEDLAANTADLVALADALHAQVSDFFVPQSVTTVAASPEAEAAMRACLCRSVGCSEPPAAVLSGNFASIIPFDSTGDRL